MSVLDHIVVTAATVEEGAAHIAACLGQAPGPGGQHGMMGTHNRLAGLGTGEYLEAIAIDPGAAPPGRPRWFDLDTPRPTPRLSNWVLRCDDLEALVARHPELGRIHALERGAFRWRMAIPEDGRLPYGGACPAALQWDSAAPGFPDRGLRLTSLTLTHPDAAGLRDLLADLVADPRITVAEGPLSLRAQIETPDGPRELG